MTVIRQSKLTLTVLKLIYWYRNTFLWSYSFFRADPYFLVTTLTSFKKNWTTQSGLSYTSVVYNQDFCTKWNHGHLKLTLRIKLMNFKCDYKAKNMHSPCASARKQNAKMHARVCVARANVWNTELNTSLRRVQTRMWFWLYILLRMHVTNRW